MIKVKPKLLTLKGIATLEEIYVSELNYLMVRVKYKNQTYISYNLSKHNPIISNLLIK